MERLEKRMKKTPGNRDEQALNYFINRPLYGVTVGCGQLPFISPGKSGTPPPPIKGLSSDLWLCCGAAQPPLSKPTAKQHKATTVIQILLFIGSTSFSSTLSRFSLP